ACSPCCLGFVTESTSLAKAASPLGAVTTGFHGTNGERGFKPFSFHHTMQVLRVNAFCTFSAFLAFPPCYVPLCLSTSGRAADLWNIPSISSLLSRDTTLTVAAHSKQEDARNRGYLNSPDYDKLVSQL